MPATMLKDLIADGHYEAAKREAERYSAGDLVQLLYALPPQQRVIGFRLLPKDTAMAMFDLLRPADQAELVQAMDRPEVAGLLAEMEADERVRLFEELPAKVAKRLIASLEGRDREAVDLLLGYPEDSAGRFMNVRFLAIRDSVTVAEAIQAVKTSRLSDSQLEILFVIDAQRGYCGYVRPAALIQADPHRAITELMQGANLAVPAWQNVDLAARLLSANQLPAVPVVDNEGRLVGDITFDDVIDRIEEEASAEMLARGGIGSSMLSRDQAWSSRLVEGPIIYAIRLRLLCLVITLIGGLVVGGVIEGFEEVLETLAFTAIFIPLVMDMGGNVGTQSTTVFARGLAWQQIDIKRYGGYLLRELRIGVTMGLVLGSVSGVVAYYWQGVPNGYPQLGLAVGLSLFAVVVLGACLGALLPWVLLRLGFDHGPAADPFITTIKDFSGLLLYFYLVSQLLGFEAI
ncbi:MAG: magnesium transporter [Cyanobium sp. PLM2.Bin73]|nr:MAG: magnesium transporter [Cyanobium sp. PLM2.Bin73]